MLVSHCSLVCTVIIATLLVAPASCQEFFITEFNLNLENAEIDLVFEGASVLANGEFFNKLTIQSRANGSGPNHTLTGGIMLINPENAIMFRLTLYDLNVIRAFSVDENSTFLSAMEGVAINEGGDPSSGIDSSDALQVNNYVPYSPPPELVEFSLDMNVGNLSLFFSQSVIPTSIFSTGITLQSTNVSNLTTTFYTLTGHLMQSFNASHYTEQIDLIMLEHDLNSIKGLGNLAVSLNSTFIAITDGIVQNREGKPSLAINSTSPLSASMFVPDATQPELTSFDFDIDAGLLVLTFTEPVIQTPIISYGIRLHTNVSTPEPTFYLSFVDEPPTGNVTSSPGHLPRDTILMLSVPSFVLSHLKIDSVTDGHTFNHLSANEGIVQDTVGNPSIEVSATSALKVTVLTLDSTPPMLVSFDLYLNNEAMIILTFNEPITLLSANVTGVTLQSHETLPFSSNYGLTLRDFESFSGHFTDSVILHLSETDLTNINLDRNLAVSRNTTFISVLPGIANDTAGYLSLPVNSTSALPVTTLVQDTSQPVLMSCQLDINTEHLYLEFSEPVIPSAHFSSGITLQSQGSNRYTLNVSGSFGDTYNESVSVNLGNHQSVVDAIKTTRAREGAFHSHNTFIEITVGIVNDVAGNPSLQTSFHSVVVTPDTTMPQLQAIDFLDVNSGAIIFVFNELLSCANSSGITISDTRVQVHLSQNYTFEDIYLRNVTIFLTQTELNAVRADLDFGMSGNNVFISIRHAIVLDLEGNSLFIMDSILPYQVIIPNITAPQLLYFVLNMDSGELVLNFNEPVSLTLAGITGITIQSDANEPSAVHTLSSSSSAKAGYYLQITVTLADSDLNAIKADELLAIHINSTFVSVAAGSVQDTQHNFISSTVLPATNVLPDITSPKLNHVSLSGFILSLTFSETVDQDTFDISQIALQPDPSSTDVYHLTGGTISTTEHSILVELVLSDVDLAHLVMEYNLAAPTGSIYISISSYLVHDMFGNLIVAAVQAFTEINTGELIMICSCTITYLLYFIVGDDWICINHYTQCSITRKIPVKYIPCLN